jgi:hypothetical protein
MIDSDEGGSSYSIQDGLTVFRSCNSLERVHGEKAHRIANALWKRATGLDSDCVRVYACLTLTSYSGRLSAAHDNRGTI